MSPIFALLRDILFEYLRAFRIVAVQSIQDGINVRRPLSSEVEGDTHYYESENRRILPVRNI